VGVVPPARGLLRVAQLVHGDDEGDAEPAHRLGPGLHRDLVQVAEARVHVQDVDLVGVRREVAGVEPAARLVGRPDVDGVGREHRLDVGVVVRNGGDADGSRARDGAGFRPRTGLSRYRRIGGGHASTEPPAVEHATAGARTDDAVSTSVPVDSRRTGAHYPALRPPTRADTNE
jgi:hypothetical protein